MSELIDREATVKQICKMGEMVGGHDRDVVISIALFVQDDKTAFPTVDRTHGKWIRNDAYGYKCSTCGRTVRTDVFENPYKSYPYCHCGARMKEVW